MPSRGDLYLRELPAWAAEQFPALEERQPGDVTVQDLAAHSPMSANSLREELNRRVKAGELTKIEVYDPLHPKRKLFVYRPVAARAPAQPAQADARNGREPKGKAGRRRR